MALRCKVIVRNISNLSDARYCAGMGVDFYGFSTDPEYDEHLSPESFKEINEWLSGIEPVAEAPGSDIEEVNNNYGVDKFLLLNPSSEDLKKMNSYQFFLIMDSKSDLTSILTAINLAELKDNLLGVIVESGIDDLPDVLNNEAVKKFEVDIYYGGDIAPDQVNELIDSHSIAGISMKGSQEIRPGFKDYDHLADVLEEIEID
ncbi:hypothetical protein [Marinigracilibium pacificum]|uniref:Phosphoribosylanthranilate isomerase n=1 Tax=Marinigracilibium pacificum TaxID=2729599 RepID=A0A848J5X8_9BACT|nr:hypothetical protein [Marinigracilibium pacificum]NMM49874.1 hypothetical protein [Marinigracilibium pacificum]